MWRRVFALYSVLLGLLFVAAFAWRGNKIAWVAALPKTEADIR